MDLRPAIDAIAEHPRRPPARARWHAFYLAWRMMTHGRAAQQWCEVEEALRVLFWHDWRWLQLVAYPGDELETLRFLPSENESIQPVLELRARPPRSARPLATSSRRKSAPSAWGNCSAAATTRWLS